MPFEYYYQLLNNERTLQPALRCPQREETVLGTFFPFVQLLKIENYHIRNIFEMVVYGQKLTAVCSH